MRRPGQPDPELPSAEPCEGLRVEAQIQMSPRAPVSIPFHTSNVISALAQVGIGITISSLTQGVQRRQLNAIILACLASTYLDAGFGLLEFPFIFVIGFCAYRGLRAKDDRTGYAMIGLGWFLHGAWDLAHHARGWPMVAWWPASSLECVIIDAILAVYFATGAKSIFGR
ncbi:MAG: hypothetical protein M1816_001268 [Peltula sp. TS41687]|nr:MAG: hypothetical protein M1816_001268 [Peltula sp. TS41687]